MAINNKYIFKYNQDGELYNYVELNKTDKVLSYFKIEGKTLIRFDKTTDTKQLITFKPKIKLKQKFMSGESFITVFSAEDNSCVQHKMPDKEKQITLIKDNISVSDFGKFVVERWKKMKEKLSEQNYDLFNVKLDNDEKIQRKELVVKHNIRI